MLQYIALVWDAADPVKNNRARSWLRERHGDDGEWICAIDTEGLIVSYRASQDPNINQPYPLSERSGLLLGRLFEKGQTDVDSNHTELSATISFDPWKTRAILSSGGRVLVDRYWGQYVAFLRDATSSKVWVLRDPGGGVPCQHSRVEGIDIYFSRLEDCERLAAPRLSINEHYLLGYLLFNNTCVPETGISEVSTVLAGECIEHHRDRRRSTFYWNPIEIAKSASIDDVNEAARLTRQTVRTCVRSWAALLDSILLRLSGGLDSSIVLSCIDRLPGAPKLVCVNDFSNDADADERYYARHAAHRAGQELVEREEHPDFTLEPPAHVGQSVSPYQYMSDPESMAAEMRFIRERQISGIFTGSGGDQVFYRGGPLPTAADFAWVRGLKPALLQIAFSEAGADGISLWHILKLAARYGWRRYPWRITNFFYADHRPLMTAEAKRNAQADTTLWHPLYRGVAEVAPSKFGQAYMLTASTIAHHVPGVPSGFPVHLSPLLSQPVLELSLRIPTYTLRHNGRDRAVARLAFSADVPREIILRRSKGFGNSFLDVVVARNIELVKSLLLDGYLVRNKLVDRTKLEQVLSGQICAINTSVVELIVYLSVEAWVQSRLGRDAKHSTSRRAIA